MKKLRELRMEKGYNQERMAMELNVSQTTISAFETGERRPDTDMLVRIARYFDVSTDYLLGLTEVKKPLTTQEVSADESNLIHLYRRLSKINKEKVFSYTQGIADH